jgi:hypothetical protein
MYVGVDVIDAHAEVADDAHRRQAPEQGLVHQRVPVRVHALDPVGARLVRRLPGHQIDPPAQHLDHSRRHRQVGQDAGWDSGGVGGHGGGPVGCRGGVSGALNQRRWSGCRR